MKKIKYTRTESKSEEIKEDEGTKKQAVFLFFVWVPHLVSLFWNEFLRFVLRTPVELNVWQVLAFLIVLAIYKSRFYRKIVTESKEWTE